MMVSTRLALVLSVALLASACSGVMGIGSGPAAVTLEYVRQFKEIDTGGRGAITLEQAVAHYTKRFTELDVNRDGSLSAAELAPMVPVMRAATGEDLLQRLDNNGDGRVSQQEFVILANWMFERARQSNGVLTLADVERAPDRDPWLQDPPFDPEARVPRGGGRGR